MGFRDHLATYWPEWEQMLSHTIVDRLGAHLQVRRGVSLTPLTAPAVIDYLLAWQAYMNALSLLNAPPIETCIWLQGATVTMHRIFGQETAPGRQIQVSVSAPPPNGRHRTAAGVHLHETRLGDLQ